MKQPRNMWNVGIFCGLLFLFIYLFLDWLLKILAENVYECVKQLAVSGSSEMTMMSASVSQSGAEPIVAVSENLRREYLKCVTHSVNSFKTP